MLFISFAGIPDTTPNFGISFDTTKFAESIGSLPIVTPVRIIMFSQ